MPSLSVRLGCFNEFVVGAKHNTDSPVDKPLLFLKFCLQINLCATILCSMEWLLEYIRNEDVTIFNKYRLYLISNFFQTLYFSFFIFVITFVIYQPFNKKMSVKIIVISCWFTMFGILICLHYISPIDDSNLSLADILNYYNHDLSILSSFCNYFYCQYLSIASLLLQVIFIPLMSVLSFIAVYNKIHVGNIKNNNSMNSESSIYKRKLRYYYMMYLLIWFIFNWIGYFVYTLEYIGFLYSYINIKISSEKWILKKIGRNIDTCRINIKKYSNSSCHNKIELVSMELFTEIYFSIAYWTYYYELIIFNFDNTWKKVVLVWILHATTEIIFVFSICSSIYFNVSTKIVNQLNRMVLMKSNNFDNIDSNDNTNYSYDYYDGTSVQQNNETTVQNCCCACNGCSYKVITCIISRDECTLEEWQRRYSIDLSIHSISSQFSAIGTIGWLLFVYLAGGDIDYNDNIDTKQYVESMKYLIFILAMEIILFFFFIYFWFDKKNQSMLNYFIIVVYGQSDNNHHLYLLVFVLSFVVCYWINVACTANKYVYAS